jgi:hypothetical protein
MARFGINDGHVMPPNAFDELRYIVSRFLSQANVFSSLRVVALGMATVVLDIDYQQR